VSAINQVGNGLRKTLLFEHVDCLLGPDPGVAGKNNSLQQKNNLVRSEHKPSVATLSKFKFVIHFFFGWSV